MVDKIDNIQLDSLSAVFAIVMPVYPCPALVPRRLSQSMPTSDTSKQTSNMGKQKVILELGI